MVLYSYSYESRDMVDNQTTIESSVQDRLIIVQSPSKYDMVNVY